MELKSRKFTAGRLPLLLALALPLLYGCDTAGDLDLEGLNGKMVFGRHHGGSSFHIAVLDLGSNQEVQVTREGTNRDPALTSDGEEIAFTRLGGVDAAGVFVIGGNGGEPVRLTDPSLDSRQPTWSPDGVQIAFILPAENGGGAGQIGTINADGSGLRIITSDTLLADDPNWSPEGTQIAFMAKGGLQSPSDIFIVNADGSGMQNITEHPSAYEGLDWSPDGERIVFSRVAPGGGYSEIWVMNRDGTEQRRLAQVDGLGDAFTPAWSPGGAWIAFVQGPPRRDLLVMRSDGTGLRRIVQGNISSWGLDWK